MAGVPYLDLLGESPKGAAAPKPPKIYPPGEEPNPLNPGGISNNELKRRRDASLKEQAKEERKKIMAAENERRGKAIVAARKAEYERRGGFWGIALDDAKVLGPVALKAAATAAAVAATGGAALGAVGITAAAGLTAAATTANTVLKGIDTGQKVVSSLKKGDAAGLAGAAASGLKQAGVETPALPSAVKAGKDTVASLNLPKAIKVSVPDPKQAVAQARAAVGGAKAAVSAAVKTPVGAAVKAAAPLIAPPKTAPAKVLTQALTAGATSLVKPPAAAQAAASSLFSAAAGAAKLPGLGKGTAQLREKLTAAQRKLLDSDAGAYIVQSKSGALSVQTSKQPPAPGAASTPAATMFSSALSGAIKQVTVTATGVKAPVIQVPNKSPIAKTPTAGVPQPPPAASSAAVLRPPPAALPAMADPVVVPVPTPAPPPPVAAPAAPPPLAYATGLVVPEKPVVYGLLVREDGTIDSDTEAWRAA